MLQHWQLRVLFLRFIPVLPESVHKCLPALVQQFLYPKVTVCSPPDKRDLLWLLKRNRKGLELIKTPLQLPSSAGIFESWLVWGQTLHTAVSWEGVTNKPSSTPPKNPALENIWG